MGLRLLVLALALWIVYVFLRRILRARKDAASKNSSPPAVNMVRCDYCGTHLPAPEAVPGNGKRYCCPAHRQADKESDTPR